MSILTKCVRVHQIHSLALRRRLWVAATSTEQTLNKAVGQCVNRIRSVLEAQQPPAATCSENSTETRQRASCFALVSQTYPPSDIDRFVKELKRQLSAISPGTSVSGTVVDQVVSNDGNQHTPGISVLYHVPQRSNDLAGIPFYIGDEHGRQRLRGVAVGRWHSDITDRCKVDRHGAQWTNGVSSVTQAASSLSLPPELGEDICDPSRVNLILLASDKEPRQIIDALDARYPNAVKLGIVGSQTPFLNGHEFTLFDSTRMYDSGVTGLAFVEQGDGNSTQQADKLTKQPKVSHDGLEAISDVFGIERAKGNVVLDLENGDAARALIASIRKKRQETGDVGMDDRLFARITNSSSPASTGEPLSAVFQVTGGDPAKGGLAVDTLKDIEAGQSIQFMMPRRPANSPALAAKTAKQASLTVKFCAADFSEPTLPLPLNGSSDTVAASGSVFGGATEGGFIYGMANGCTASASISSSSSSSSSVLSGTTECSAPGSAVSLELPLLD
ncbi:hypothetical protein GGI12_002555 [Dipsacomyces acuminosporus]|nr:hypothetical protein GGI12_002555 [Dipsacomyces acuminosporus]